MKSFSIILLGVFVCNYVNTSNLPGPQVYVVTPSSKTRIDEGRSAPQPFYYHNWMKRMDTPFNKTTTTTVAPKVKTPDLIFAEFEANNMKHIRKLLEKEIKSKTTTTTTSTMKPIYVSDEENNHNFNYGLPTPESDNDNVKKDMPDYYALYNNMYENANVPEPSVYLPSTSTTTTRTTTTTRNVEADKEDKTDYFALYNNLYNNDNAPSSLVYVPLTSTSKIFQTLPTTSTSAPVDLENIWHIIDSQKHNQYLGQWEEVPLDSGEKDVKQNALTTEKYTDAEDPNKVNLQNDDDNVYKNFALPGFGTKPGGSGDNESRAIRTEPNLRFPYVSLKPFQIKNSKKPFETYGNSKKGSNMFTNLDNFIEVKHPVRGEAQDTTLQHLMPNMPIDRYNAGQPYLPINKDYGKQKQSSPGSNPVKSYSNLVPPPPPPSPKVTDNDFPPPSTYESYPPYISGSDTGPPAPRPPPVSMPAPPLIQPSIELSSPNLDSSGDLTDSSYDYKPPAPSSQKFIPTVPPLRKPFNGYSYNKPPMTVEAPPTGMDDNTDDKPDFSGYNYDKPDFSLPEKPAFSGYHYDKPEPPLPPPPPKHYGPSFDHAPPQSDSEYPEITYDKPQEGMDDAKAGGDMKDDDIGMVPPPVPAPQSGVQDDSGFPHDFPDDFKYHHFDDHDFFHHHHHHTTTTTTTEMPRVNRFSYYYLGKKLYYLPLYFSVYFIVYVGALIIKAVLRHKIVYPNSWRPNDQTATFFSKRSVDSMDLSTENLHEITGRVTHAIAKAAERYMEDKNKKM